MDEIESDLHSSHSCFSVPDIFESLPTFTNLSDQFQRKNYFKKNMHVLSHFSHVWLFATLWPIARQAPLSMGFPRQEYWSGLPFPSADLPNPGIEPTPLTSPAWAGVLFTTSATWKASVKEKWVELLHVYKVHSKIDFQILLESWVILWTYH